MSSVLGIFLALLTALFKSSSEILSKFSLLNEVSEYITAWAVRFFALPPLILAVFIFGISDIEPGFWKALLVTVPAGVLATVFYMKAIKLSDISLMSPLAALSPMLVLISAPFIVAEFPGVWGFLGIMITTVGIYVLKLDKKSKGYLKPFKAIKEESGVKYMLVMLLLYSLAAPVDKIGVEASSAIVYSLALHIGQLLFLTPLMFYKEDSWFVEIKNNRKSIFSIGFLSGVASVLQMTALTYTLVVYVITVKRSGILFSVLAGHFLFDEENIFERFLGAIIIVVGLLLIALSSI